MAELEENQENVQEQKDFDYSILDGGPIGYVPLPTNVGEGPTGSLWKANFRDSTTIGAFINTASSRQLGGEDVQELSPEQIINRIPRDLVLGYADRYIGVDPDKFDIVTSQIRQELNDKELIAAHPWKSFAIGLVQQPLDPVNWLPLGALYKNVKAGSQLAKTIVGSGAATALGATAQEAIISRNQMTREIDESVMNVAVSGIIGAALGGIGAGLTMTGKLKSAEQISARRKATAEVMDVITDTDKELDANGLLKSEDLINIPAPIRKLMNITPMNRLLNSEFGTSKFFSNAMFEHNYTLLKHLDERTDGGSVETLTRLDIAKTKSLMVDYQDIYFQMNGISSGPFKGTRAKLQGVEMTLDDFNTKVWRRLSTTVEDANEHVNRAARLLEDGLFNRTRDRAIELGLLTEADAPRNAPGYIMSVYNKNKIIEQGGKSARHDGSFPIFLHNKFKEIQNQISIFKESPLYKTTTKKIEASKKKLDKLNGEKKKAVQKEIKELEDTIRKAAPPKGLDSEGKLFPIVNDQELWTHVEQTIDHILGDSDGALLNPILAKLQPGPKPLKQRKMTITQEEMMEWHITDIPKLVEMYSRAMHPMIRLTEFAQKHGAKDINEMREMFSKLLNDEFEEQVKGKTGKEAQKLRKMRDQNAEDMKATIALLQGVYGDGPNVLNSTARQYYQNFLKWNYIRLLGYMTLSSIADAGAQVFIHGPYRFIHDGLVQTLSEARKISKQDLRAIGYGNETELGSRIKSYADHSGLSTNPGPFTRGLDVMTQNFGNLSLMNQWNSWQQSMAGHIAINRTLQTIHKFAKGEKVSQKELLRLNRLGLDQKHYKTIFEFTKNNDSDGTLFADWTNWDIQTKGQREALEQFQASVAKEIDNIVIVPGLGDKPLIAQTPTGKLLFQFKTFLMASTNRLLYSGIQRRDELNTYLGVVSMLAMGGLSYVATTLVRGEELDLSFQKLARESVDKSGLLGIWGEVGNIASKFTGVGVSSRYQSRDFVGSMLGPTAGAVNELRSLTLKAVKAARGEAELSTRDARKLTRLVPMQNLAYIHQLQQKAVSGIARDLGAIDAD